MKDLATEATKRVTGHIDALRAYSGTDQHIHLVGLLEALTTVYMHDLAYVQPQELQMKQGALRQVMAIQAALEGEIPTMPKV